MSRRKDVQIKDPEQGRRCGINAVGDSDLRARRSHLYANDSNGARSECLHELCDKYAAKGRMLYARIGEIGRRRRLAQVLRKRRRILKLCFESGKKLRVPGQIAFRKSIDNSIAHADSCGLLYSNFLLRAFPQPGNCPAPLTATATKTGPGLLRVKLV
jgi:hypothetical protein